jgi:hypothetical protein
MACWFGFVFLFAAIYYLGNGIDTMASQLQANARLKDYTWFSIATAVTPGYAGYKPTANFKLVAGLEAIFGTFMWACIYCHIFQEVHEMNVIANHSLSSLKQDVWDFQQISISLEVENFGLSRRQASHESPNKL